jgi:DNA-binding XRE family transcriptional regulator
MNINDKIKQILIDKNLTPSYFADEIGVQRSSISHILSGRNRPSFDIIQKIIRRFPDLGYEWIMEEDPQQGFNPMGQSSYDAPRKIGQPGAVDRYERFSAQPSVSFTAPSSSRNQRNEIPPVHQQQQPYSSPSQATEPSVNAPAVAPVALTDKKVERILIFYTDGSFREYSPSLA